jgi:Holliday junction resolvase RusA-like endonuclease
MKVTFHVTPVPASRPCVSKWSTYYKGPYKRYMDAMKIAVSDIHITPFEGNVYAKVDFFVPMAPSWLKSKKEEKLGKFCDNNKDIDNYCKAILDALNGKYYIDDNQIVMIRARMYWTGSDNGRTECEFLPIQE